MKVLIAMGAVTPAGTSGSGRHPTTLRMSNSKRADAPVQVDQLNVDDPGGPHLGLDLFDKFAVPGSIASALPRLATGPILERPRWCSELTGRVSDSLTGRATGCGAIASDASDDC